MNDNHILVVHSRVYNFMGIALGAEVSLICSLLYALFSKISFSFLVSELVSEFW